MGPRIHEFVPSTRKCHFMASMSLKKIRIQSQRLLTKAKASHEANRIPVSRINDRRNNVYGLLEPPRPKGRRFWGNHHGCVAGRETLGVTLLTRHRLSRQQHAGVQPDYALTPF